MDKTAPRDLSSNARQEAHRRIESYLKSEPCPRLHLGAGPVVLPGWLNSDLTPLHSDIVTIDPPSRCQSPTILCRRSSASI